MIRHRGFTLIELVIAVLISAILAVMTFTAMREALDNRERIREGAARVQALQFTMYSLVRDFSQLEPRPIREPLGDGHQPALIAMPGTTTTVSFTRAGWMNPAGGARSTLQRVRYEVRDGALHRDQWRVLDAQLDPQPDTRALLQGVTGFSLRFMNDGRDWQDSWPPPAQGPSRTERELRWRPLAVEVTLELEGWGTITRLIEVPG